MNQRSQGGQGRLGFIIALAVFGTVAWTGYKVVPVRITAYNFRDTLRQECRMGAVRNSDSVIAKRIMESADELGVPLKKKDLEVRRTKSKMVISASYEQPIDLKFTTYVYRFSAKEEAPLF